MLLETAASVQQNQFFQSWSLFLWQKGMSLVPHLINTMCTYSFWTEGTEKMQGSRDGLFYLSANYVLYILTIFNNI